MKKDKLVRANWHILKSQKKIVAQLAKERGISESAFIRKLINYSYEKK